MKGLAGALCLTALLTGGGGAEARDLPIYLEDNHAGTFYWLAQHLDLEEPCTLIHFDAHSDASGIFDSDKIRDALRVVASPEERAALLDHWREEGTVQCFNWIEPLMPAPISRVIWVAGDDSSCSQIEKRQGEAIALLDGHLEAAPRRSGTFRDRYVASDLAHLSEKLQPGEPIVITIDLDSFAGLPEPRQRDAFARVWNFATAQQNVRALTFAISRAYLTDDDEADRLVRLAIEASRLLPTAHLEFEPFATVAHDHSRRAQQLRAAGKPLPYYNVERASPELKSILLAEAGRLIVLKNRARWDSLLRDWQNEAGQIHLEAKNIQVSTDGIWRIRKEDSPVLEIAPEPWTSKVNEVQWFALLPAHPSCSVSELNPDQVGFIAQAAPRPQWKEKAIESQDTELPTEKLLPFFDAKSGSGSVRLRARALVDGKLRETPVMEIRRSTGTGFRAAVMEQFALPYVFGSGMLSDGPSSGAETNLGSDCANFLIYAMRRQGKRVPWSDPKQLRKYLEPVAMGTHPGATQFSSEDLERGLIVHLGTHLAAVMEDRPPLGLLDENDVVAHQLKGFPEMLTLGELLRRRQNRRFDLYRVAPAMGPTLTFGGDIMLGRSCAQKIRDGVDPFAGIHDLLARSVFAAANLECTLARGGEMPSKSKFAFQAPAESAVLLRRAGFRAVGLANNHALDFGNGALQECARILREKGIDPIGVAEVSGDPYAPKVFELPGPGRIALLAISDLPAEQGFEDAATPLLARASDRERLSVAIRSAREKANLVACLVHWGIENTSRVTDEQRELARWLIDQGVDLVVGSHPHCLQPLDFYHGRPIAYSLGNLIFDGATTVPSWNHGALLRIHLSAADNIQSTELIPLALKEGLPHPSPPSADVVAQN